MKMIAKQFSLFLMVGALSALIQFSILISLVEVFSAQPIWSSALGYIGGAIINYSLNHYFTFKSSLSHKKALIRFSLNSFFGFLLNLTLMSIFLRYYSYLVGQVLASSIILIWNFLIHRYWTFGSKRDSL
jgi:putative flippase GtrA